jgi:hypothetical protein
MDFHHKKFKGVTYSFGHLSPVTLVVPLNGAMTTGIDVIVSYSCHCFTEGFDASVHGPDHTYTYGRETRAFDVTRYNCSLQLPAVIQSVLNAHIHRANKNNYTYVAQIPAQPTLPGRHYSIFFDLKKDSDKKDTVRMYVQSAYLSPLKGGPEKWRFKSLVGQIAGVFPPKEKKAKPKKKKAP